jgi:hypothetical protein
MMLSASSTAAGSEFAWSNPAAAGFLSLSDSLEPLHARTEGITTNKVRIVLRFMVHDVKK